MKKISIVVPCYNEEANILNMYHALTNIMKDSLSTYAYDIIFVDNKSQDSSRTIIRKICSEDQHVKAVFNRVNCGPNTNLFHGLRESDGDCVIPIDADFQEPVDQIPVMVQAWEKGSKVVCMIKTRSKENKLVYFAREIFYRLFAHMSATPQLKQFTGFGLYDKEFVDVIRQLKDTEPCFKGIIAEYAPERVEIPFEQQRRQAGKSSMNFMQYYDSAMLSFTSYTTSGLRIATFGGFFIAGVSFLIGLVYLILKLTNWNSFPAGNAPILLSVLFLGGVQLFFTGLLGEYIMSINKRVIDRPMVVVEERLNFEEYVWRD